MKKLFALLLLVGSLSLTAKSENDSTFFKVIKVEEDIYRVLISASQETKVKLKVLDCDKKVIQTIEREGQPAYHLSISFKKAPEARYLVFEEVKEETVEYSLD